MRQKVVTFCAKLLHFGLMLHVASKVVTFRVNVTFCVNCYILRRNIPPFSLKGKRSGAVIRLRGIINSVKWALAWLSFKAAGLGWYEISHIYWKSGKK